MELASQTEMLPRLLYVADVPVEASYHGSALLYRLLEDYPVDRLMILEVAPHSSLPKRRLPDVRYRTLSMGPARLRYTRFARLEGSWQSLTAGGGAKRLRSFGDEFEPEALLTVAQGYSWLSVARFAQEAKLPLHLILHDHWSVTSLAYEWLTPWRDRQLGKVYRSAASRLCVSRFMEEDYRLKYGVSGRVLYPSRAKNCPSFHQPPSSYGRTSKGLVGAFAGSIFDSEYAQLIRNLAECLEARGGHLLLFGPQSPESLRDWGLDRPGVLFKGLVKSEELICELREQADFVFVPMVFDSSQRNMLVSFPSKLTDYTATGLPLLICGPSYCSAVRWAEEYAPVAEVVTSPKIDQLKSAVVRLEDVKHRRSLGRAASQVGDLLFSHDVCRRTFWSALRADSADKQRFTPVPATAGYD
jgi:hypothetical protein